MIGRAYTFLRNRHTQLWYAFALLLLLFGAVVLVLMYVAISRALTPPFEYVDEVFPVVSPLCPGDAQVLQVPITVNRAPVVVFIAETWYDIEEQRTILDGKATRGVIIAAKKEVHKATVDFVVPETFTPGKYEYWRSYSGSRPDILRIPFTIAPVAECEARQQ